MSFVDLDDFKRINDTPGHDAGDDLLVKVAQRLDECLRGIALFPRDGETVDTLLKHADTAMYEPKRAGKNRFEFFNRQMSQQVHAQLAMERRIREGLDAGEFVLHFQPKVRPANGQCFGSEALLRWTGDDGKPVSPAEFIPVAQATGLILPLGEWVFRTACRQASDWARDPSAEPLLPIAVNISSKQFAQPGFAAACRRMLEESGARPHDIEVELTESVLVQPRCRLTRRAAGSPSTVVRQ